MSTRKGKRGHFHQTAIESLVIYTISMRRGQIQAAEWYVALIFHVVGLTLIMMSIGIPLPEVKLRMEASLPLSSEGNKCPDRLIGIRFIRNRMFYAKPDLDRSGKPRIGLKRISQL